jgi:glucuronate isomerase
MLADCKLRRCAGVSVPGCELRLHLRLIGMLTDSRSFRSYPRHEYCRRTLCNRRGNDIQSGGISNDLDPVGARDA